MLSEAELKEQLRPLDDDKFAVPAAADLPALVEAMTTYIGSPDPRLRDELIYPAFATWILKSDIFTPEQLRALVEVALDEQHIFYQVGESNSDSVFTRTFSMLLLPLLLIAHRKRPYLTPEEVFRVKEEVLRYIGLERDYRGFVEVKGWAHAVAHTADTLDDLARCVEFGTAELSEILNAIKTLAAAEEVFAHEEDERLSIAVGAVVERNLLEAAEWDKWLADCVAAVEAPRPLPQSLYCNINMKNLLRCSYFRLNRLVEEGELPQAAADVIGRVAKTAGQLTRF